MNPATLLGIVEGSGGALFLLLFFVILVTRGTWVAGRTHRDLMRDRDFWREVALTAADGAKRAVRLADRQRFDAALADDDA